jgi:AAA+ superfamily predicted ATPase
MLALNAHTLEHEITWFNHVMQARFKNYFEATGEAFSISSFNAPDLMEDKSIYARTVLDLQLSNEERLILVLSALPMVRPQALDLFFTSQRELQRQYTEFGGVKGKIHSGFLPTIETALFLMAGENLSHRLSTARLFEPDGVLLKKRVIRLVHAGSDEPFHASALTVTNDFLSLLTTGVLRKPDHGTEFPARLITTKLAWKDLVLNPEVRQEVENVSTWLSHAQTLLQEWGLERAVKPGYRCLFYGPPGTGKTLTACLIGAQAGVDVYRIDLSMVVSKFIGETEKNLANVFDQAQDKNWILFFDEADALFGKRTESNSSNDRYANQEISYLLQRVEDFPGVVILASNLKSNIDEAFARRFQSAVYFSMPDVEQRLALWQGMFQKAERLDKDVDFDFLAEKYELSGGAITNVVRYAAVRATSLNRAVVMQEDLIKGIAKELIKEGRTL